MRDVVGVLWTPVQSMQHVAESRKVLAGLLVVSTCALLLLILGLIAMSTGLQELDGQRLPTTSPDDLRAIRQLLTITVPAVALLAPFAWWAGISGVIQLATRVLGGRGPFSATLAVVGVGSMPLVVLAVVELVVMPIGSVAGAGSFPARSAAIFSNLFALLMLAAHVALVVIGMRFASGLTYGQSGGACSLSCVGCLGLAVIIGGIVGLLAGIVGG